MQPDAIQNINYILLISQHLSLPYYCVYTCIFLYQRLHFTKHKYSSLLSIISCISLAMKIEETVKKLSDIVHCCRLVINKNSKECDQKELRDIKDLVMDIERLVLEDLDFDVEINSPHCYSLSILHMFNGFLYFI